MESKPLKNQIACIVAKYEENSSMATNFDTTSLWSYHKIQKPDGSDLGLINQILDDEESYIKPLEILFTELKKLSQIETTYRVHEDRIWLFTIEKLYLGHKKLTEDYKKIKKYATLSSILTLLKQNEEFFQEYITYYTIYKDIILYVKTLDHNKYQKNEVNIDAIKKTAFLPLVKLRLYIETLKTLNTDNEVLKMFQKIAKIGNDKLIIKCISGHPFEDQDFGSFEGSQKCHVKTNKNKKKEEMHVYIFKNLIIFTTEGLIVDLDFYKMHLKMTDLYIVETRNANDLIICNHQEYLNDPNKIMTLTSNPILIKWLRDLLDRLRFEQLLNLRK